MRVTAGIALMVWLVSGSAQAQGQTTQKPPEALTAPQVERMWDDYVIAQAQGALNLTGPQFMRFRNRLLQLQQLRRRLQRERNVRLREAQQLIGGRGPVADPAPVMAKLKEYDDLMVRSAEQLRQAYV